MFTRSQLPQLCYFNQLAIDVNKGMNSYLPSVESILYRPSSSNGQNMSVFSYEQKIIVFSRYFTSRFKAKANYNYSTNSFLIILIHSYHTNEFLFFQCCTISPNFGCYSGQFWFLQCCGISPNFGCWVCYCKE